MQFGNNAGPLVTLPWHSQYAINSFYGLLSASYKDYLFADITGRQDWNSVLATPTRTANAGFFYPSANLSFVASDAFRLPAAISFAKLRFSVSGVGSGGTTPYLTAYNYTTAGSLYNGGLSTPSLLANPDLRPLRTITTRTIGVGAKHGVLIACCRMLRLRLSRFTASICHPSLPQGREYSRRRVIQT